jgi:hypothetical protein
MPRTRYWHNIAALAVNDKPFLPSPRFSSLCDSVDSKMESISDRHLSIGIYESRNAMGVAAACRFQTCVEETRIQNLRNPSAANRDTTAPEIR